jgi:hypothetical protein
MRGERCSPVLSATAAALSRGKESAPEKTGSLNGSTEACKRLTPVMACCETAVGGQLGTMRPGVEPRRVKKDIAADRWRRRTVAGPKVRHQAKT